jgi:hypothetical protein
MFLKGVDAYCIIRYLKKIHTSLKKTLKNHSFFSTFAVHKTHRQWLDSN